MATHLITGAGSGIGSELTDLLHQRDDSLVLLARSHERAAELMERYAGARALVADLADPIALEEKLSAAGLPDRLDSVVHAAGVVDLATVADLTATDLQHQLSVNLVAPAVLTRACLPALRSARGTVVFVNSGAGQTAHPGWAAYAASKFGVRGIADALRGEEQANGVRVTTVYPGRTATPMQEKVHAQEGAEYDPSRWIEASTVAATILHCLDLPADATVTEVNVRPGPARPAG